MEDKLRPIIHVAGDYVEKKEVQYEVSNVETGGIGIQIVNGEKTIDSSKPSEQAREQLIADEQEDLCKLLFKENEPDQQSKIDLLESIFEKSKNQHGKGNKAEVCRLLFKYKHNFGLHDLDGDVKRAQVINAWIEKLQIAYFDKLFTNKDLSANYVSIK
jgi:hypothetical protein